jgi:hypothetical protein
MGYHRELNKSKSVVDYPANLDVQPRLVSTSLGSTETICDDVCFDFAQGT